MDGVVYRGENPIESGIDFLRRLQKSGLPFLLVTNHACKTPQDLHDKLMRMGVDIPLERFLTSGMVAASWLKKRKIQRVTVVGEKALTEALEDEKISFVPLIDSLDDPPKGPPVIESLPPCLVVGLDRKFNHNRLRRAARLVQNGALYIGTNPDNSYPVGDETEPECGTILAAITTAVDQYGVKPLILGKPEREIYEQAADRLKLPVTDLAMIGDRLDTDIAGARNVGMMAILVLTGHTKQHPKAEGVADLILDDLSQLSLTATH